MMLYDWLMLDSALLKKPLSDRAVSFMSGEKVLISSAFFREAEEYAKLLDSTHSDILKKNIARLLKAIKHGVQLV